VALTDTLVRVAVETYAEMADRYDVYLETGVNLAQDWRVVCVSKASFDSASPVPGGVRCDEENPAKVMQLRDPDEPRDYAYESTTDRPSNMALVFDPDGRLISKQVKTYVTPSEVLGGLDLVPGEITDAITPLRTPVGTLGFVTSKDAWMPDLVQKLDQGHVDLLIQPEWFINDVLCDKNCPPAAGAGPPAPDTPGMFSPDTLLSSGYSAMLRHPSFDSLVVPSMTGNIFPFSSDAQQHIAVKPRRSSARGGHLVGQPAAPGLVEVAPWAVPDPVRPDEPVAERRARLIAVGDNLNEGSGVRCPDPAKPGDCENGHVEGVIWRDLEVDRRPRYRRFRARPARTRFSRSRPVRRSRRAQRNAAVALRGRRGVVAYEERRRGRDQILLQRTRDSGRSWSRPVRPTGRPRGSTDEWWPAVALGSGGRVTVAWVDRSSGRERAYFSRSTNGGRRFGPPRPLDAAPPPEVAQWKPALAQGRGDLVHAAFVDERPPRSAVDDLPEAHLYYARIRGGAPEPARRLDTAAPAPLAERLDNSWAPSVAVSGDRVLVAWLDFAEYDWDVYSRVSGTGGESFGEEVEVSDAEDDDPSTSGVNEQDEALTDTPRATFAGGAPLIAWTDWRKRVTGTVKPHQLYDTFVARPGGRNLQVDPHGERQVSTFSPAICGLPGGDALVAFQDASRGQNDVRIVRMRSGERRGRTRRVDDAGRRGGNAWRPQLACSGGRVLAAWEDERDGPPQVYAAVARAARIR
jgi:hypothetical protein